ncbi:MULTISPECIES: dTDP-4-dehydrorhamnose reductase [Pseudomonadota]|uniref:dTDP-4-dehydrorhamnose reductase n=1 Tax=Pseudomonadota TaxID=1224 RepID=UPI001CA711D4|nr:MULTISPECIES: dTDP-4-dehydrorhamnose reductase [Pseudomonadota]MBY8965978.1 dTDP-4-dehydrorhamnose reductase [Algiphilus acroporae]MCI5069134.1 dTDP-4-dehydrorhamnose reductase [Acidovorax sp.]MCI5103737.1 dTDP-4-dehydrorhamnose reductase [Algiphilus sp.]
MQRLLVTGAHGQVARALTAQAQGHFELHALDRARLDITDAAETEAALRNYRPDCVVNAAAYTAVDKAEQDQAAAYAVNRDGAAHLATACARIGARLIHLSTDFVFDGGTNVPYRPDAETAPLSVYGASKWAGELVVRRIASEVTVVRTSWVYGPGGSNFVRTMLHLLQQRAQLSVVADQFGSPTHTHTLARFLLHLVRHAQGAGQTLHWADAGAATWYDFAQMARLIALRRWPERFWGEIVPTDTAGYPTPAKRPRFSVLDTRDATRLTGLQPAGWSVMLERSLMTDDASYWLSS